jgi:hypothetical protein
MANRNLTHIRGTVFRKTWTLSGAASFYTQIYFTMRVDMPCETVLDDATAFYQGSLVGGQITIDGDTLTVEVPVAVNRLWPNRVFHFDLKGFVDTEDPADAFEIDSGSLTVTGDVTRRAA